MNGSAHAQGTKHTLVAAGLPGLPKGSMPPLVRHESRPTGEGPESLKRVVAICFYGRSGSFLLHSLLDSHPDVVAIPPFLLLQNFYDFWHHHGALSIDEMVPAFVDQHKTWFSASALRAGPEAPYFGPEGRDDIAVDERMFAEALRTYLLWGGARGAECVTRRRLFQSIHLAYQDAIERPVTSDNPLVVFSLHTPLRHCAEALRDDFPATRFIHVVREPVSTFGSHLFHHLYEFPQPPFEDYSRRMLDFLLRSDRPLVTDLSISRAVRFEDLHRDCERTMRAVAQWLALPWDPALLRTTYNGLVASHNRRGRLISGTDPKRARYRPPNTLHAVDRAVLRLVLWQNRRVWGYGWWGGSHEPRTGRRPLFPACCSVARLTALAILVWIPSKYEWLSWRLAWQQSPDRGWPARRRLVRELARQYVGLRRLLRGECHARCRWQELIPPLPLV